MRVKAQRGLYAGSEDFASATKLDIDEHGFRQGFNEGYAWRTFPHPELNPAMQGAGIKLAGPSGEAGTQPEFDADSIALNGLAPDDYESFVLSRVPEIRSGEKESFDFTKTEYRAYDPVVVSILAAAVKVAPDAIKASSDGGDEAIKLMF